MFMNLKVFLLEKKFLGEGADAVKSKLGEAL